MRIVLESPAMSPMARPDTLAAMGIEPETERPKKAKLGSGK